MKILRFAIVLSFFSAQCFGGGSLVFDGLTTYITMGNNSKLDFANTLTASCWFNGGTITDNFSLFVGKLLASTAGWNIDVNNVGPGIRYRIDTSAGIGQTASLSATALNNNWHYVVLIINSGVVLGYFDGIQTLNGVYNHGTGLANSAEFRIGNRGDNTNYFNGKIANVRIYNKVLSSNELLESFKCSDSPIDGLVGSWMLWDSTTTYDLSMNSIQGKHSGKIESSQDGPPISICNASGGGN